MGTFDYDGVRALVDPAFVHHVTHPDGQKTKADQVFFITFVPGTTTVLKVIQIADSLLWYKIDEKRGRPVPEVQLYH
ncbi:hypothetical protein RQP46_003795 [Phenoliferia psychrophenolica]